MTLKHFLLAALALALCACGRSSPTSYYLLESAAAPLNSDDLPEKSLRVAQVRTPGYLSRNNIVSRLPGQTKLVLAEFHLWAEPVGAGVGRVLCETLAAPMLKAGLAVLPPGDESGGDYVLLIDIQRLDGNFNQKAVLESHWALTNDKGDAIRRGVFAAEEMVPGADYNLLAGAESRLIRDFGAHLARVLPPLMGRKAASHPQSGE